MSAIASSPRGRAGGASGRCRLLPAVVIAAAVALRPGPAPGRAAVTASPSPTPALDTVPGGFLENALMGQIRPRLTAAAIQALLPARGPFTFPPPYGTTGVRLTNADDCAGGDCVDYVGYSYWRNINNHVGQNRMLIFLGLDRARGGPGPSLFSYDKTTDQVANLGPLFDPATGRSWHTTEGWYWSMTKPTKIYVDDNSRMLRYDVMTHQYETVFDVAPRFGADTIVWQMHSSDDDMVHSATLRTSTTYEMLGCVVYHEDTGVFQYFPKIGNFNECSVDKSGRWLMSLENVDGKYDLEMRIFNLKTGDERMVWDQAGAVGHADMGYGYVVGTDNWNIFPNAILRWDFDKDPLSGLLVSHNTSWAAPGPNHIAHGNARPDLPPGQQYACGSSASTIDAVWSNEIICFRLDGSLTVLVVAPVLTDMAAPGGGTDYAREPKGNLDVTGQYFIWTANAGGDRLDAFIVKVPGSMLLGPPVAAAPPVLSVTDSPDPVPVGGSITYTLTYSNLGATDLTGVAIVDRVPPDTSFVSATGGGSLGGGVATWSVGALPAGGTGAVSMTVRVSPTLAAGETLINGTSVIGSNETATTTGYPAATTVVADAPPGVASAIETFSNSIYVVTGGDWTVRIDGASFQAGAAVDLGADISAGPATLSGTGRLSVPIAVPGTAALGPRTVTVNNPDGLSGSRAGGLLVVKPPDVNRDCLIDGMDLNTLARAWNTAVSEPGFAAAADLDGDGYVGPVDLSVLAVYFGLRLPVCP